MHVFLLKKVPMIKANSIPSLVDLQQRGAVPHQGGDQRALHNLKFQQPPSPNIAGKDGRYIIIIFFNGERIFKKVIRSVEEKVLWILRKFTTSQCKKCLSVLLLRFLCSQLQESGEVVCMILSFLH